MIYKTLHLITFILIFSFSYCVSISKEAPQKRFFTIEANASKIKKITPFKFSKLRINKLRISPNYEGREFVYRKDFDFESDFYNQFLVSPSTNITEQVILWINKSGISEMVTNRISSADSNLILEGNINLLCADFSGGKIHSLLEIEFYLSDNTNDKVLFKKLYSKKVFSADKAPVSLVKAWNEAITQIFSELENDLRSLEINPEKNSSSKTN